jgi:hypothetical protein
MKKKTPEEIVNDIQEACKSLGWAIAMDESKSAISGLVIGQLNYVENVIEQLEDVDNFSIYQTGITEDSLQ